MHRIRNMRSNLGARRMRYSKLTRRLIGEGADAWSIHARAGDRKAAGDDVILLSVGDPDFDTPRPIVDTAVKSMRDGRTHYTPAGGISELRAAAAQYHRRLTGQSTSAENVVIVPGAQCGLFCAAMCLLEPGDNILVPEPMYVTYEGVVGASGADIVPIPLKPENAFHLDVDDVKRAITPSTRAILFNTPHNPTGAVMRRDTLEGVGALAQENNLWVLSDEVYAHLTYESEHLSPASVSSLSQRCITIYSLSKSYAMTGWRLGWVVAPTALTLHHERLLGCMLYGSPTFIQDAAIAALNSDDAEIDQMRGEYRARRDLVCERLSGVPGLSYHRPEAGMYVMLDIRATGLSGKEFANQLLDEELVSLLPGEGFGPSGAGHVRFSLCVDRDTLEQACHRIERFMQRLVRDVSA